MMEPKECKLEININPHGTETITYPDCLTTPLYHGTKCLSNMSLCYENIPDPSGKPSSYWRTRDNVSVKVFKQTQIKGHNKNEDSKRVLTELILPPKTLIHGIDPINTKKYKMTGKSLCIDKYRAEKAYVCKQTIYSKDFSEDHKRYRYIQSNEIVTQSVSIWDNSFIYTTGFLVTPRNNFHYINNPRKITRDVPKVYTCESGIHFYHEEINAKE